MFDKKMKSGQVRGLATMAMMTHIDDTYTVDSSSLCSSLKTSCVLNVLFVIAVPMLIDEVLGVITFV